MSLSLYLQQRRVPHVCYTGIMTTSIKGGLKRVGVLSEVGILSSEYGNGNVVLDYIASIILLSPFTNLCRKETLSKHFRGDVLKVAIKCWEQISGSMHTALEVMIVGQIVMSLSR